MSASASARGSLACVGLGMMLGAHLTPRAMQEIAQADVVFVAASDPLIELWVQGMHADVRSLQPYYGEAKPKDDTYRDMVAALLAEVRAGHRVCGVFYGHPGVFARVPHDAIAAARAVGHVARMEPGISAEDCLYADLGIDPGDVGCQHYEASQFMAYKRRIDSSACLILWQVGMAGDLGATRVVTGSVHRQLLVDLLAADYPLNHEVIAYEAATLAIRPPRISRFALCELAGAQLGPQTTLVVPPCRALEANLHVMALLGRLDAGDGSAAA